jgi:hypothetical protein
MRKIVCLIYLLAAYHNLYAVNIYASDIFDTMRITDTAMKVEYTDSYSDSDITEEYQVVWETVNDMNYISFDYTGNFLRRKNVAHGKKRYLVLYGDCLIFYNDKNQQEYYIISIKPQADQSGFTATKISASSELKEKDIVYRASNLFEKNYLRPWAEGAAGDGIGQTITINFEQGLVFGLNGLYVSNGYVDYNRPYLYGYNNRIKKIRVRYIGHDEYKDFELEDTYLFQYINIGIEYNPQTVLIEILEVYKGSRWDDTCVNNILPIGF